MIIFFKDIDLEELIKTGKSRKYKDISKDKNLVRKLVKVYEIMRVATNIKDISVHSYLHYEKLRMSCQAFLLSALLEIKE